MHRFQNASEKTLTTLNQLIDQIHEKQSCQRSWIDSQNSAPIDMDSHIRSIGPKIPKSNYQIRWKVTEYQNYIRSLLLPKPIFQIF